MKTTQPKESEVKHEWYLIDATDKPAGRLAVELCRLLRGRGKPDYTPHIDMGDFVVVINSAKVGLTGNMRQKNPNYILWHAVRGMLPKNHLSRQLIKRLKLYPGAEHPHAAQNPKAIG